MPDVLIVKLGSAPESLRRRRGDFEHWFAAGLGVEFDRCSIASPQAGESLPEPAACCGVILTGSDAMLTDNPAWSLKTQQWLGKILEDQIPVLGICYGHQLLAQMLGGKVGWSPNGEEIGTVTVSLTAEGRGNPLLSGLPEMLTVQSSHGQAVLELPSGAQLLAFNAHEPVQGFAFASNLWGFQFHPEFDADISRAYIQDDRAKLEAQGCDPDTLLHAARDAPHGASLLRRFAERLRG